MAGKLEGRVGVITGGASGIGRATALIMAREGAKVVVSDVQEEGGEETVNLIKQSRGEARFVKADVANSDDAEALVARTVEAYGRLDWAFNNAGIAGAIAPTHDYPDADWKRVFDINVNGVWYCMRAEIRRMLEQGGGVIVNTASDAGLIALPGISAYVAAKHAVVGLTKAAALEYAKSNIRVVSVCPGYVETPILDPMKQRAPEFLEKAMQDEPVGRLGRTEEIGEAVAWLCSDGASFVTGIAMPVDGGLLAH
jgi:NAD(P)-dependent dehydrogenase (short-subunit alcohol dehydrogenase family)